MAQAGVKTKKVGLDLTSGPIVQSLIIFVIPIVIANLVQQLYGLVDLIVIGKFMGPTGTVGVSTGGELNDMMLPVATSFGAAGQIYIAQLAGAKHIQRLKDAIGTLLTMMLGMGIVIMAVVLVFHSSFLRLLNCPEEAFSQAANYMIITAFGFPFVMAYNAICGVLRGMGESRRPMLFICIAAVVNIFLDLLLVIPFHLEAAGTAIATLFSQIASCAAAFIFMYIKREQFDFKLSLSYFKIHADAARVILTLGIPQVVRSMLVRFSMLYVNASVNSYGLVASATNSVGNKLQTFLELYSSSFMQAASAMVGQNLGARRHERAEKTVWYSTGICIGIAAFFTVLIRLIPRQMFGIFTNDPAVIKMGVVYLNILIVHLFLSALTSTQQSMVLGSGNAMLNFIIGIVDGVICKVGLGVLFAYVLGMGFKGFWWGTAFSRLIPGLMCLAYMLSGRWKTRKLLTE